MANKPQGRVRLKRRRHSLRQLAERPVTIGDVTIEAVPDGGQLVVRVWHPEEMPVNQAVRVDKVSPNPNNAG